jgi:hypothetical protein
MHGHRSSVQNSVISLVLVESESIFKSSVLDFKINADQLPPFESKRKPEHNDIRLEVCFKGRFNVLYKTVIKQTSLPSHYSSRYNRIHLKCWNAARIPDFQLSASITAETLLNAF